ncbi:Niemann-Pick C1 protein [Phytophthora cinnamomi]|uniref:Niemann-Pick C1 protein n=1 Tax=Phytophthora cinnamomi TaxID=4785 RepID=UPI00355A08E0|nr:Niemann-Pick C1 protein [Phytophthora cinnamomi]
MGRRRAPYKMKVQLPADDPDSESDTESEKKAGDSDSTNFEEGSSSEGEESEAEDEEDSSAEDGDSSDEVERGAADTKQRERTISNDGSSSDDSDFEVRVRSRLLKLTKSSRVDVSSSDESSSGDEQPRDSKLQLKSSSRNGVSSVVGRASVPDSSGSEEDSDLEEKPTTKVVSTDNDSEEDSDIEEGAKKNSGKPGSDSEEDSEVEEETDTKAEENDVEPDEEMEAIEEETEEETEEEGNDGSDTEDEDWQPQEDDDEVPRGDDDLVAESDDESGDEWDEEMQNETKPTQDEDDALFSASDLEHARFLVRNIMARVPLIEETAIRRGVKLSGPPREFATTHPDEYARKFRWPQHIRNLRKTDFSQDVTEVLEDFEVLSESEQSTTRRWGPARFIAKAKTNASDHFAESLLIANGRALQGIDDGFDYDKRCWASLPTKKKPIANWRFVLEHARRTMCESDSFRDVLYPPMKQETLGRITNRLKRLYGHTTQHEEYDIFEHANSRSSQSGGSQ